jgi:hypothetical protein
MAATESSAPAHPPTRIGRAIKLHREHSAEIERTGIHTYRVPSCTGTGTYTVYSDLRCCSCPDHRRAKVNGERCKHYYAVEILISKRRAACRLERAGLLFSRGSGLSHATNRAEGR